VPLNFKRHILSNGLRLIIHEDHSTPLVACNLVYNVGSKDENPEQTGMAHLFEHYMFCGSKNIAKYDYHLQKIGAIHNAYTSQDITHYYIVLPANNLETALWLESDRMLEPAFLEKQLSIQKQVVIEEFKENYLNNPFGDRNILFYDFVYEKHPYKWLPIGKELSHIENVTMDAMKHFFFKFYRPNNAVLTISGNVVSEKVISLVEKWFGDIPSGEIIVKNYPQEDIQQKSKFKEVYKDVPYDYLMKAWKICDCKSPDYYTYNLISDIFSNGKSSILYKKFVKENCIFNDLSCYLSSTFDPGLFILSGRPANGIDIGKADEILSDFLFNFSYDDCLAHDLQKVKNVVSVILLRNEIKIEDRSSFLAVSEIISKVEDFENDKDKYCSVSAEQVINLTKNLFAENKTNTFYYRH
jgi:zinc protease